MSKMTLSILVLVASAATSPMASGSDGRFPQAGTATPEQGPLTRQQVVQETLTARRSGTLLPAGESAEAVFRVSPVSSVSREAVKAETSLARSSGTLQPAGEAALPVFAAIAGTSRSREEVKQETISARRNGTLIPAGEAVDNQAHATAEARSRSLRAAQARSIR